jgi:hypothetical protein
MITLHPPIGSGVIVQLALVAEAESELKIHEYSIVCHLLLITDIAALGLSARDCFQLFNPQIYIGLARACLGLYQNLPLTLYPKFSFLRNSFLNSSHGRLFLHY